eukprot:395581-Ditylum_brightwellii.AAC.1
MALKVTDSTGDNANWACQGVVTFAIAQSFALDAIFCGIKVRVTMVTLERCAGLMLVAVELFCCMPKSISHTWKGAGNWSVPPLQYYPVLRRRKKVMMIRSQMASSCGDFPME